MVQGSLLGPLRVEPPAPTAFFFLPKLRLRRTTLSFFSSGVKPGVTCDKSTERGATALINVRTYTPEASVASESLLTGSKPACFATFSLAHESTSASVNGFDEPDL